MWYMECGGYYIINGEKVFGRNIFIDISDEDAMNKVKKRFGNTDVYTTSYVYSDKDQNKSDLLGSLYFDLDLDLDGEDSYNKIKADALMVISYIKVHLKVPKEHIRIFFSGNKGFHIIIPWQVLGIRPSNNLNVKYKMIATEILTHTLNRTVDVKIYDKKRLFRLPHSINGKTGLYKIPITEEMLRMSTLETMRRYASQDRTIQYKEPKLIEEARQAFISKTQIKIKARPKGNDLSFINKDFEIPICVKLAFERGANKGCRNNTLIVLASSMLQKGTDIDECINICQEWNINKNDPMGEDEVENTVRSAYNGLVNGRRYGCTSIKELGLCIGTKCKLFK